VDICPENILKTTRTALAKLLRSHGKMPFPVKDMAAVQVAADSICSDRITPVFTLSSVSGQGEFYLRKCVCSILHLDLLLWSESRLGWVHANPHSFLRIAPAFIYFLTL
jgi:GTPase